MRVIVCGGRDFADANALFGHLDRIHAATPIEGLAQGGARGADFLAFLWAQDRGIRRMATFRADWSTHGRAAGPIRNRQMLTDFDPDLVVAFPGGAGTADMMGRARAAGVRVITPMEPADE